jgi:hypothetical protein
MALLEPSSRCGKWSLMPLVVEDQRLVWRHVCERFGSFGRIVVVICFIIRGYVGVEVTGNNAVVNVGANVNGWMDGWDTQWTLWYWRRSSLKTNRLGLV